ncbi:MAG: copper chaperone PCu(A)C [Idiomarina sp.]|nr:copper chaperone PCu(A)C [Idiomarina sp.]
MRLFILSLLSVFSLSAFATQVDIDADDLWLRESVPGQPNGAGFGTLRNHGELDVFLIGATVTIAQDVEIHQHIMEGEQMRMEQIEALTIPAGSYVTMQPGGYHLMLMGLTEPLVEGEVHTVLLVFSDGTTLEVEAPVRALVRRGRSSHGGH